MKRRFEIKYQLFINEKTGVATCKLVDISVANWINKYNTTPTQYEILHLAVEKATYLYRKNGWPATHATPSPKATFDANFGLKLAKKRLLYSVLKTLVSIMYEMTDEMADQAYKAVEFVSSIDDTSEALFYSIHGDYVNAARKEGDIEYVDNPNERDFNTLVNASIVEAYERNHNIKGE